MKEPVTEPSGAERAEQLRQLRLMLDLSRQVAALDSLDDILEALVSAAMKELGAQAGSLFVHDDDTGELIRAGRGKAARRRSGS